MESKKEIYDLIPPEFYPKTILCKLGESLISIQDKCLAANLEFPLIAKPDIGMRGMAVQKLENESDLRDYVQKVDFDFLIQEYIDLPNEVGIFYVRFPNHSSGKITGIVAKEFLTISGDGRSTIQELVERNPRYHLQLHALLKMYGARLLEIPLLGEKVNLVPYGNHARGSRFVNATSWASEKLTSVINEICLQVPDFYYGRLDIKYNTIEQLEKGENLSIIELNGAGSEPTHIYDPGQSIFTAWKEIVRHFSMLFQISRINNEKGHRFLTFPEGISMLRQNKLHVKKLQRF
jgi:hypothetical protein